MSGVNQKLSSIETVVHEIRNLVKGLKGDEQAARKHDHAAVENTFTKPETPMVPKVNPTPSNPPKTHDAQYQPTPKWKTYLEATGIIFGIGYAVVTGLLWLDQNQNFKIDQRAWVGIQSMDLAKPEPGKPLAAAIKIINSGKTFALETNVGDGVIQTSWTGIDDAARQARSRSRHKLHKAVLYPNIDVTIPVYTDKPLTPEEAQGVITGRLNVYLIGDIGYRDIFGKTHTTHYCGHFVVETNKFEQCDSYAN